MQARLVWLGLLLCLTAAGCGDSESHREATEPISPPQATKHAIPRGLIEQPREPQGAKGRFREFKNFRGVERRNDYTPEQIAELERLSAIGYVSGSVPSAGFQNLTDFDEERAESGLNFYLSGHGAEAALADMRGNVLHRWSVGFADVWPDLEEMSHLKWTHFIRRAHLFENGDILAVWDSVGIARIDKDSNVVWAQPNMAHHDLQVMPSGDIYVITSRVEMIPRVNAEQPVRDDQVTLLDSEGNTKRSVSILEAFEKSETYRRLWEGRTARAGELFHTNTLHVLDGSIEDDIAAFKKGNVLVSSLLTDIIAVIDLERGEVVWAWGEGFPRLVVSGERVRALLLAHLWHCPAPSRWQYARDGIGQRQGVRDHARGRDRLGVLQPPPRRRERRVHRCAARTPAHASGLSDLVGAGGRSVTGTPLQPRVEPASFSREPSKQSFECITNLRDLGIREVPQNHLTGSAVSRVGSPRKVIEIDVAARDDQTDVAVDEAVGVSFCLSAQQGSRRTPRTALC
jgi:hypothetical protein